jgi:plastocyanin
MFTQLRRKFALVLVTGLSCLLFAACAADNGGAGNGGGQTATTNTAASGNKAPASSAPNAAGNEAGVASQQVEMDDDVFKPAQLTIPAGTKVTWVNTGKKAHTVVSNDKLFDSGLVNVGGQFTYTFNTPGTYAVHCAPHAKMKGQIVVQ